MTNPNDNIDELVVKITTSFLAAAGMILGVNREVYEKFFSFGVSQRNETQFVVIEESATPDNLQLVIPIEIAELDSDRIYFSLMKDLAKAVLPFIPVELIKIPQDKWTDPIKWGYSDKTS